VPATSRLGIPVLPLSSSRVDSGFQDRLPINRAMHPSRKSVRGDVPIARPLSRAENRWVAELQLLLKHLDGEIIKAWSSVQVVKELRARRQVAQAELDSIARPPSDPPPRPAS
jgi:hypothetical protein